MFKKEYFLILALLAVIGILSIAIFNLTLTEHDVVDKKISHDIIANESTGSVEVIRNIGNPNSKKIAYVVGVHPLENATHKTLVNILPEMSELNYCYDIYMINVTKDIGYYGDGSSDNSPGRQNGQNLALKYVYPEILNGDYELAVDVHSNVGAYPYKTFVFSPVKEGLGVEYAQNITENSINISYYAPDSTTSGPYLTIPLNENGIPAFYYEEYSFASQSEKNAHMVELIRGVDGLIFE